MKVSEGKVGRVFVVRLEDGDRLPDAIENLAADKNIRAASVILLGGIRHGTIVVGPETPEVPPKPMTAEFQDVHEIAAVGTIFANAEGKPILHLHAALGRDGRTITGCTRPGVDVWLIAEAIITEITDTTAHRVLSYGLELLEP
jgi:predicted DNA-binding protein with PD1-like motif